MYSLIKYEWTAGSSVLNVSSQIAHQVKHLFHSAQQWMNMNEWLARSSYGCYENQSVSWVGGWFIYIHSRIFTTLIWGSTHALSKYTVKMSKKHTHRHTAQRPRKKISIKDIKCTFWQSGSYDLFTFTEEYRGVIESFITWCNSNYLKINISTNNKTLVDHCCKSIRV